MLDPTLSDAVILRSVRKYFVDEFKSADDIPVFFEFIDKQPTDGSGNKLDKWLCVVPGGVQYDTLSSRTMQVALFTSTDVDGLDSADFRDLVFEKLVDHSQTDCRKRLPCYNASWELEFTAVITVLDDIVFDPYTDGINLKILPFRLNWGAK